MGAQCETIISKAEFDQRLMMHTLAATPENITAIEWPSFAYKTAHRGGHIYLTQVGAPKIEHGFELEGIVCDFICSGYLIDKAQLGSGTRMALEAAKPTKTQERLVDELETVVQVHLEQGYINWLQTATFPTSILLPKKTEQIARENGIMSLVLILVYDTTLIERSYKLDKYISELEVMKERRMI